MAIKHTFVSGKADGADNTVVQPSNWNAVHTVDPATITRAMLEATAVNWRFLGNAVLGSAAATVAVTLLASLKHLRVEYYIAGYAGAGGIAMVQYNLDTGNNYNRTVSDNSGVPTQTNATSGIRVANTTATTERFGEFKVRNVSAQKKFTVGHGTTLGAPTATGPNQNDFSGWWTNVAGLITSIQLGNAGVNLLTGSELIVWGRDDE
jgi:hypothetical protein